MGNCCFNSNSNNNKNKNNKLIAKMIENNNGEILNVIIIASDIIEIQTREKTISFNYNDILYISKIKKNEFKIISINGIYIIFSDKNFMNWYYNNKRLFNENKQYYKNNNLYTSFV